jgi:hypothetical protein
MLGVLCTQVFNGTFNDPPMPSLAEELGGEAPSFDTFLWWTRMVGGWVGFGGMGWVGRDAHPF